MPQEPEREDWFAVTYRSYGRMLFRIAIVHLGNKADAEEALQEVFMKLLYQAPDFRDGEHERAWLIRVTTNQCRSMMRSVWRRRVVRLAELEPYAAGESDLYLLESVLQLPAKYKAVIHLHYYEGYQVKEMADILGIRESAVKMRLKRGRELLKLDWREEQA